MFHKIALSASHFSLLHYNAREGGIGIVYLSTTSCESNDQNNHLFSGTSIFNENKLKFEHDTTLTTPIKIEKVTSMNKKKENLSIVNMSDNDSSSIEIIDVVKKPSANLVMNDIIQKMRFWVIHKHRGKLTKAIQSIIDTKQTKKNSGKINCSQTLNRLRRKKLLQSNWNLPFWNLNNQNWTAHRSQLLGM